jgi:hypothetical protein
MFKRPSSTGLQAPDQTGTDPGRVVVQFRPRTGKPRANRPDKSAFANLKRDPAVKSLARYHRTNGTDNYRHRMIMNAIVLAFVSTLVLAGVWMANMIVHT